MRLKSGPSLKWTAVWAGVSGTVVGVITGEWAGSVIGAAVTFALVSVVIWWRRRTPPCDGTHQWRRFYQDGAVRCHDEVCQTWLGELAGGDPDRAHVVVPWPMNDGRTSDRMASGGW